MARIAGVDIPNDKQIETSLTYIFDIGRTSSKEILAKAEIEPDRRVKDLTEAELTILRRIIDEGYKVEGDKAIVSFEKDSLFGGLMVGTKGMAVDYREPGKFVEISKQSGIDGAYFTLSATYTGAGRRLTPALSLCRS